jgi:hypothetical protein
MNIGIGVKIQNANALRGTLADAKQIQQIVGNLRVKSSGSIVPAGGGSGSGGSSGGASSNPLVRLQSAHANLQQALANGNPSGLFGTQYQYARAYQAFQRAQAAIAGPGGGTPPAQPSFMQRVSGVVASTRFGVGGGGGLQIMPLIGQLSKLFGASPLAGGIIMAGVTALTAFVDQVHAAANALTEIRSAALISGGTAHNMGFLGALGIGAGQVPGLSGSLRGTLAGGDAFAMGQAGRLGLPGIAVPTALAGTNQAAVLELAIKKIGGLDTAEKRLAAARNLQMESIIPQIEMYARHKNVIEADTKALENAVSKRAAQAGADFNFQAGRAQTMAGALGMGLSVPILNDWAKGLGNLADVMRGGVRFAPLFSRNIRSMVDGIFPLIGTVDTLLTGIGKVGPAFKALYTNIETFINGVIDKLPDPIKGQLNGFRMPDWKDLSDPIKDLTGAVQANTDAQNAANGIYKNGTYGGSSRARGALPNGLRGQAFSTAVAGNALRLGAFSL